MMADEDMSDVEAVDGAAIPIEDANIPEGEDLELSDEALKALMDRDWEALLAVVWIATRAFKAVADVAAALDGAGGPGQPDYALVTAAPYLNGLATPQAEQELLLASRSGEVQILGLENGAGNYRPVPADAFVDASVTYERHGLQIGPKDFLRPNASRWTHLHLQSVKVLERWQPSMQLPSVKRHTPRLVTPKHPPIPQKGMDAWIGARPGLQNTTKLDLLKAIRADFPEHQISRDVFFAKLGPRKRGPK